MRNETQGESENDKHASSMRGAGEERKSHTLTLTPGDQLMGLSVFQIDQPHQQTLVQVAAATSREVGPQDGIQGSAIFSGMNKGDVAVLTQWVERSLYDQAPQTLLKPIEGDLYRLALQHHITGQTTSCFTPDDGFFHFINVFRLASGRSKDFLDYFQRAIPLVSASPGFVSTNVLISLDECHAVNLVQFQTRQDFRAILRRPRILLTFSEPPRRRIILGLPRFRDYDLVAASSSEDV
ncbi:MAG: antibiotic biosynthesis monooxygenase [Chloroflexota bacterium]|nr:antibiotic biosynthesis monooxygenase [Chloroflexota bacterium]